MPYLEIHIYWWSITTQYFSCSTIHTCCTVHSCSNQYDCLISYSLTNLYISDHFLVWILDMPETNKILLWKQNSNFVKSEFPFFFLWFFLAVWWNFIIFFWSPSLKDCSVRIIIQVKHHRYGSIVLRNWKGLELADIKKTFPFIQEKLNFNSRDRTNYWLLDFIMMHSFEWKAPSFELTYIEWGKKVAK